MTIYRPTHNFRTYRVTCDHAHLDDPCLALSPEFKLPHHLAAFIVGARWKTIGTWHLCPKHSKPKYDKDNQWIYDHAKEHPPCLSNDEPNREPSTESVAPTPLHTPPA